MIFDSSRTIPVKTLNQVLFQAGFYATIGVLVTMFLIAIPFSFITGIPFLDAIFLGAIMEATDPVAVGDVASVYQFTHMADFMARLVVKNALSFGRDKVSSFLIPWATYTEPEVAHVGLYERDLKNRDIAYETYKREFDDVDRAILEGDTEGFVKIYVEKGSDTILAGC